MTPPNTNGKKKRKYGILTSGFLGLSLLCVGYASVNAWSMHTFDKYVIKPIEIAANVPTVSRSLGNSSGISMESALETSRKKVGVSRLQNPAIIWETPLTDVGTLAELLGKAIERTRQIGEFQQAFDTGKVSKEAPKWVKNAHVKLNIETILSTLKPNELEIIKGVIPSLTELAASEYGQRIGSEYEALNTVISGGTRIQAKSLKEKHRSLLDTLDKAGGFRSIIRFQADDYKQTHAHVFIGYLLANMGYVSEGLNHFKKAKQIMGQYPDDKNLSILRDTPELSQRTINGLLDSSIRELQSLDNDPSKYSTGWWKRLRYYNQSIGGQSNPNIQDMAEKIQDRYYDRFKGSGLLGLVFFFFAGRYGKRFRNAKRYEVKHADNPS